MTNVRSFRWRAGVLFVTAILWLLFSFEQTGRGDNENIKLAKAHFEVGAAHYRQGHYKAALKEFAASFRLSKRAALLFNMAQCYERLGDLEQAISYREKYLELQPKAPNKQEVTMQIQALKARLAATSILLVGKLPRGAKVILDGRTAIPGPSGLVRTSPGSHRISVRLQGEELFSAVVALAQGQQLRLPLKLRQVTVKPRRRHPSTQKRRYLATWVTLGSAGALLALATGLAAGALTTTDHANDSLQEGYLTTFKQLKSKAKNLALGADISFGLAGGLAVTSLVLYLIERHKTSKERTRAQIIPMVGPGSVGMTATWDF